MELKRDMFLSLFKFINMNKILYITIFITIAFSGYNIGDTISDEDLNTTFNTCFGDIETVTFGDYQNNSVIWLNLSASW